MSRKSKVFQDSLRRKFLQRQNGPTVSRSSWLILAPVNFGLCCVVPFPWDGMAGDRIVNVAHPLSALAQQASMTTCWKRAAADGIDLLLQDATDLATTDDAARKDRSNSRGPHPHLRKPKEIETLQKRPRHSLLYRHQFAEAVRSCRSGHAKSSTDRRARLFQDYEQHLYNCLKHAWTGPARDI